MAAPEQTQTMVCYRHPSNETAITCSNCGRPICTECMVFAPVGIKCPECAGLPTGAKKAAVKARSYTSVGTDFIVTKVLIGLNVLVFLAQVVQSGSFTQPFSDIFFRGALAAPPIAQADQWYRLVTCAFLHGSVLHIFFNMLMLW
jgi:ribosomal protein S27E